MQYVATDDYLIKCLDNCLLISRLIEVFCSYPPNSKLKKGDPLIPRVPEVPIRPDTRQLAWEVNASRDKGEVENSGEEEEANTEEFVDDDYEQYKEEESS